MTTSVRIFLSHVFHRFIAFRAYGYIRQVYKTKIFIMVILHWKQGLILC